MANINPIGATNQGATVTRVATTPAGDQFQYGGGNLLLHFENGHASPITVNFAPVVSTMKLSGAGEVTVPTRSLAIAAGAEAVFMFSRGTAGAYVNAQGYIPVTYTGGNAALTVTAVSIAG